MSAVGKELPIRVVEKPKGVDVGHDDCSYECAQAGCGPVGEREPNHRKDWSPDDGSEELPVGAATRSTPACTLGHFELHLVCDLGPFGAR
eukprot:CAMPEP_0185193456 /NCGR_PEP_ID=MMETSP1140-20130426/26045_1 /TAXON_ID=298111 /ORGANISM="Pavlova sp., Strain CCMP459" /LENGTH=89 /DNA_ID=CAMNT_0027760285 /DNA_START=711 /DNA_END=978 /DNA_ORIENTATION=+